MTATHTPDPLAPDPPRRADVPAGAPVPIDGIRSLLEGLDRRQRQAVTHKDGPVLVVAGPGTGKTEVITRRIAWLIAGRRARPSEILALTFTERAADEMQARVDLLVPYGQADTNVHTFHAFGDWLLREHGFEIGRPDDPRVIGRSQAVVLLRDHLFEIGLDRYLPLGDPTRFVGALVDLFTRAKEEGISADDLAHYATDLAAGARAAARRLDDGSGDAVIDGLLDEAAAQAELARAYAAYQALLIERKMVDHGDQVAEAVRLLDERAAVRQKLRRRFRYVVVDEAQDANPQQMRMVRRLVGAAGNVMFVGDDDQAIYSFRGAVGEGLAGLDDDYVDMRDVVLRRNYRSRAPILETARRLIRHNDPDRLEVSRGIDKTLTAVRRSRRPAMVSHRSFPTATQEADHVASDIRRRLEAGAAPGSIAVLVRTNVDAGPVLASLDVLGVPRRFSGRSGLLAHREVRDVLSLLRTIANPDASEDLYAVATSHPYRLAGEDLTSICELASRRHRSLWAVLTDVDEQPGVLRLSADTRGRVSRIVSNLRASVSAAHEQPAPRVLYEHMRTSGWLAALVQDAERGDDGPLHRVARIFEMVSEQVDLVDDPRVMAVAPALRALIDAGYDPSSPEPDDGAEAVSVLTVHQAKGLEFPTVFVVGMAEGRFPIRGRRDALSLPSALTGRPPAEDTQSHIAEERRLFYVAMTRARDELVLTHAATSARGGRRRRPSPFLAEALGHEIDAGLDIAPEAKARLSESVDGAVLPGSTVPHVIDGIATSPVALSFTQVDDYLSCPLKYRLRHQVRVPTPPNHALVLGSALHQAVASVNISRLRDRPVEESAAIATLEAHWRSEGFLSQEHEAARLAAGKAAVSRFVSESRDEAGNRIVAVELPFSVRIGEDRVRGRYDAIRDTDSGIVITDYKSGDMRDPVRARSRARSSLQLQLYSLAYAAETGSDPAAVELHFLQSGIVGRVEPTMKQLERAKTKVEQAADGIKSGRFEATPGFPACDWCPYRRICPASD